MSNLKIIEELCAICSMQNKIIREQSAVLAQMGAIVMEEEKAEAAKRFTALIGSDEAPDCACY